MDFISGLLVSILSGVSSLLPFIVLLGVLVSIHEWGHFIVARLCGVRVEVFSLGFGKKLLKWKKGDTLYSISLIPLGGYVKMFGDQYGKKIPEKDQSVSFINKKLSQRAAIVVAGPLTNLFLAIFIFSLVAMVGHKEFRPVVGEVQPNSVAEKAGFHYGDEIVSVDNQSIKNWNEVEQYIFKHPAQSLTFLIETEFGEKKSFTVESQKKEIVGEWGFLEKAGVVEGLSQFSRGAVIGISDSKSLAHRAGLETFDRILSVDGKPVRNWKQMLQAFQFLSEKKGKQNWQIKFQRGDNEKTISLKKPPFSNLKKWGIQHSDLFIFDLKKDGVAKVAGVMKGDLIVRVNGKKLKKWQPLVETIKGFDPEKGPLKLEIKRDGQVRSVSLVPELRRRIVNGIEEKHYMLGIVSGAYMVPTGNFYTKRILNPFWALLEGLKQSWRWCAITGIYVKKLFLGEISKKTIGGPIAIGRIAYDSYSYGFGYFFKIMAVLSIQLFLINMLPVPILDGGHLLFYLVEFFNGAPLSMKKMMVAQYMGLFLLLALILFTTFNDLDNWINIW